MAAWQCINHAGGTLSVSGLKTVSVNTRADRDATVSREKAPSRHSCKWRRRNFFFLPLPAHKCCRFLISDAPFFSPQAFQNIGGDIFTHPHLFLLNMYEGRWQDKTHYFTISRAPLKRSQLNCIYSNQADQSAAHWHWRNRLRWIHKVSARRIKTKRPLWSSVKSVKRTEGGFLFNLAFLNVLTSGKDAAFKTIIPHLTCTMKQLHERSVTFRAYTESNPRRARNDLIH